MYRASPEAWMNPEYFLVPCLLQPHLAAERPVDKEKVAKRENHTEAPPNESDAQSMMTSSRVVDGQATRRIRTGRKHDGIEPVGGSCKHADDVAGRGDESGFLPPFSQGDDHRGQSAEYNGWNHEPDRMLLVVVEQSRADPNCGDHPA